jgi:hypothetical protein
MTIDDWANWIAEHETPTELETALARDPSLATQRTSLGNTLLHEACWLKRQALVAALLDAGADVNARGDHGRTPLHCAVNDAPAARALPIVRLLLARGARPDLEDNAGFTVAAFAEQEIWDDRDAVLALLGAGPSRAAAPSSSDYAATVAHIGAIRTENDTAAAIAALLEAFRDERGAPWPPVTARFPAADPTCIADLARLLDELAATSWAPAARAWLRAAFKPAHAQRLLQLYRSSQSGDD